MAVSRSLGRIFMRHPLFPSSVIHYSNIWVPSKIIGLQGADFISILHYGGLATRVFKTMVEIKNAEP